MRLVCYLAGLSILLGCSSELSTENHAKDEAVANNDHVVRAKKMSCGHMPPVNKEKLILMLRKSKTITPDMSPSQQQNVLMNYLKEKRERFNKQCR